MAIARLPNDLLGQILGYLDTGDRLRLTECCSTFASVMPFHEIDMDVVRSITPFRKVDMNAFPVRRNGYSVLEDRRLRDALSKASTYASLASCRIVRIGRDSWWKDGGLMLSEAFPNLKHLVVDGCVRLGVLRHFIHLRTLIVYELIIEADCDERDLAVLCGVHLLRARDLSLADLRAGAGNAVIPGMRHLRTSRTIKFHNDDAVFISKVFPNLKEVTLCNLHGQIWIEWFTMCPRLEILKMLHSWVTLITNPAVPPLGLRTLCLANGCKADGFSFLKQLHFLAELVIWCDNFTCGDLEQLSSSASLTYLDVSHTKTISDELLDILLNRRYPLKILIVNVDSQWHRCPMCLFGFSVDHLEHSKSVTGFSTRALAVFLESNPGLEVLSVNSHRFINDSIFAKDCDSFKTLHSLRLLGTSCTNIGIAQLCHHRKTAIEAGDILPTMALAANWDLRGFSETLQDGFIVLDNSMWVSKTELEMMSFMATKGRERVCLKREWQSTASST